MRRISAGVVIASLVFTLAAPAAAMAAAPSATGMLKEQVASQTMIGALLGTTTRSTHVTSISFSRLSKTSTKAVLAVTARTAAGSSVRGRLVMRRYASKWYFYSITRGSHEGGISNVAIPAGITSSVVSNAIAEQRNHQWLLSGLVSGGYKKLTVLNRTYNASTRRVGIKLSGGTRSSVLGRVYAYRKTASSGQKYWFISTLK